jgi:cell division protein FtsW
MEYSLLLTATLCLLAFGAVMVFSASSAPRLVSGTGDSAYYFKRTLLFGVGGLLIMRVLMVRGTRLVRAVTPLLLLVSFVLLIAVLVAGVGTEANGAQRWIAAGPVQIQPSELAKLTLILYGASLLARRPGTVRNVRTMFPYLFIVTAACALIVVEPDLGTAIVAAVAVGAVLVAAGAKLRHLAVIAVALGLIAFVAIMIEPYRRARLLGFLHPGTDVQGSGFQSVQAMIALGSGGIFGVGLGESVQKVFYLPEAHTDMIAAVIGEELGLLGISVLVGLYGLFGYAGLRTAQRARDRYGKLLAAGLTTLILVQAVVNLFAVMGLAPLTGVPLPFVSYGNSNMLVLLASAGLILNVARKLPATSARPNRAAARDNARRAAPRAAAQPRAKLRVLEGGGIAAEGGRSRGQGRDSRGGNRRARRASPGGRRRAAR